MSNNGKSNERNFTHHKSFDKKLHCHRSARNIFSLPLFDSAKHLAIRLSCKEHEIKTNQLLIEKVYIKCLECNDQVCVNVNKSFSSNMREDPTPRQLFL